MAGQSDRQFKRLSPAEVSFFREQGYLTGLAAIPPEQAARWRARLDAIEPARLAALDCPWYAQAHLLFTWADALIRHPTILDTMEDLLGPDLLVEAADLFVKAPRSESFVSFHQDSYYWDIEPDDMATAWVALGEATIENGCMQYGARTHLLRKRPHEETFAPRNALRRGQTMVLPEGTRIVDATLDAGQMSIHHCLLAHASGPNRTDRPRMGLAIRYIPAHVRIVRGPPMAATLVRGRDRHGNFAPALPRPKRDLDAGAIAAHRRALAPHAASNYATV